MRRITAWTLVFGLLLGGALGEAAARRPAGGAAVASRVGEKLFVLWQGAYWAATVIADGERVKIHYDGWGAEWDEPVGPERVKHRVAGADRARQLGERVFVSWGGAYWPSRVLAVQRDGRLRIRYEGYGEEWDESIGTDRLIVLTPDPPRTFAVGQKVDVEWRGSYWPAVITRVAARDRYRIHYVGYGDEWDEDVGPARLR